MLNFVKIESFTVYFYLATKASKVKRLMHPIYFLSYRKLTNAMIKFVYSFSERINVMY